MQRISEFSEFSEFSTTRINRESTRISTKPTKKGFGYYGVIHGKLLINFDMQSGNIVSRALRKGYGTFKISTMSCKYLFYYFA